MMRKPAFTKAAQKQEVGSMVPMQAPVAGWNARDPVESMAEDYAITLDNWFPSTADVVSRKGWEPHLRSVSGAVLSLMSYASTTTQQMFAANATNIYNASAAGAVGASVKTITNGYLKSINMNSAGGSYLFLVNGTDDLIRYDGTTWLSINGASVPAITGKATSSFSHINAHKRRLYFVEKNSMSVWYLAVNTISGAVTEFPLGQVFTKGGKLIQMATWTIDGGAGTDDFAVFITSEGEVAVYKGSDPSDATNWSIVGVYYVGKPIGTDPMIKYEGDILVLAEGGLFPLSKVLQSADIERTLSLSNNIEEAFISAASLYGANSGWNMTLFPGGPMLIVNIPLITSTSSEQYVMNTTTKAWAKFTGMNAFCWTVFNKELYYGGSGGVFKAWTGYNDNGAEITLNVQCAYTYLRTRAKRKMIKLVQPHVQASGQIKLELGFSVDFEPVEASPLNLISYGVAATPLWGVAVWGSSLWGANNTYRRDWKTVATRDGIAFSFRMKIGNNKLQVRWSATDYIYETGAIF